MIDTGKFFFNRDGHSSQADALNALATRKNVQVSRWVNNSRGRQIVTYIVHGGERNEFASKQENVLFQTSEDAGRGGQVRDEAAMMAAVSAFLNSIVVEEQDAEETYRITTDVFGDGGDVTFEQAQEMVTEMGIPGWDLSLEISGDELRIYAERNDDYDVDDDEWSNTPQMHTAWQMHTSNYGHYVIGELVNG